MAFGLEKYKGDRKKCVVFDFGGGTHDVTVLEIYKRKIENKAVKGDPNLGGQDIDIALMKYCIVEFNRNNELDLKESELSNK